MKKIGIFTSIILMLSFAVFFTIKDHNEAIRLNNEYIKVKINNNFIGEITYLYTVKGIAYVVLNNSIKMRFPTSRNYEYSGKNRHLSHMLSIGDTLIKKRGTFDLIVKKKDKEYHFVIGKFINKEKGN